MMAELAAAAVVVVAVAEAVAKVAVVVPVVLVDMAEAPLKSSLTEHFVDTAVSSPLGVTDRTDQLVPGAQTGVIATTARMEEREDTELTEGMCRALAELQGKAEMAAPPERAASIRAATAVGSVCIR